MDRRRLETAVDLLAPAEAAAHIPHPTLWSWRRLLVHAHPDSTVLAFFLADVTDLPAEPSDEHFRRLLTP